MLKFFLVWLISEIVGALCWTFSDDVLDTKSVLLFGIVFVIFIMALLYAFMVPYAFVLDLFQFKDSAWVVLLGMFAGGVSCGLMFGLVALLRRIFE